jgi:uncharacterized protein YndB with AHSA1/START domain
MSADRELVITRILNAPRARVFAAWVDQNQAARWWGPRGFTSISCTMDVRVGGVWRRAMRSPEGIEYHASGVYQEIVAPERLVFTYAWENNPEQRCHETLVTLTFGELGGKTELTLQQALFETVAARDGHEGGWSSCLERFADYRADHIDCGGGRCAACQGKRVDAVARPAECRAARTALGQDR